MAIVFTGIDPTFLNPQKGNPRGDPPATARASGVIGNIAYTAAVPGAAGNSISVAHVLVEPTAAVKASAVIGGMTYRARTAGTTGNSITVQHNSAAIPAVKASRSISGMTYTARTAGANGNNITVTHTNPAIAGVASFATLGGLTYTAVSPGAAGNNISVTATTGSAGAPGSTTLTRALNAGGNASFSISEKPAFYGNATTVKFVCGGFATPVSSFTESQSNVAGDSSYTDVVALVNGNGNNGAVNNVFVDTSTNIGLSTVGSPLQGSFSPFSKTSGGWSTYHPSRGNNTNANSFIVNGTSSTGNLGTNFTLEFWFNGTTGSITNNSWVVAKSRANSDASDNWFSGVSGSSDGANIGKFYFIAYHSTNQLKSFFSSSRVDDGRWHHCAFVKQGTTYRIFVDGNLETTEIWAVSPNSATTYNVTVGGSTTNANGGDYGRINCYLSNVRLNNTALYTSSFSRPASPLTSVAGTIFLACQDNRLRDNGPNNYSLTVQQGTPTVLPFSPFEAASSVALTETGGSVAFDGGHGQNNGFPGHLSMPHTSDLDFGTGDFTIECWAYLSRDASTDAASKRTAMLFNKGATSGSPHTSYSFYVAGSSSSTGTGFGFENLVSGVSSTVAYTGTINKSSWNHFAVSRSGTTTRLFLNGVLVQSGTLSNQNVTGLTSAARIGATNYSPGYIQGFPGYISNFRVVKGTALYTGNFSPPESELTAVSGTKLLTCKGSSIVDSSTSANAITVNYGASVSSFTPFDTAGSARFDGVSYLSVPDSDSWRFSGNFTIEAWINPTSVPMNSTLQVIAGQWSPGNPANCAFHFSVYNARLYFAYGLGTSNVGVVGTSAAVTAGVWQHVAVTRSGSSIKLFVNGVQDVVTGSASGALNNSTEVLTLGQAAGSYFNGSISNFRIVNGTALYTSSFAPPVSALSVVANTKLLTFQKPRFTDASTDNVVLTATGLPRAVPASPFTTPTANPTGSGYFSGTSDYLSILYSVQPISELNLGTGDFTIESWFYIAGNSSLNNASQRTGVLFSNYNGSGLTNGYALQIIGDGSTTGTAVDFTQSINSGNISVRYTAAIPQKTWNHVAISRSGSTARLFLNGSLVASSNSWGNVSVNGGSQNANIGGLLYSGYNNLFNGYISGLRVVKGSALYTAAFTPSTQAPTPVTGTVMLVNFANSAALDSSKNFLLECVGGAQTSTTVSKFGGSSLRFNGTNSVVSVGQTADPRLSIGTSDFTLEGWVYLSAAPTTNSAIYANYGGARAGAYLLRILSATRKLAFYVYPGADIMTSTTALSAGTWYHVAVSRTGTSLKLFLDGNLEATVTGNYDLVSDPSHPATLGGYWQAASYEPNGWLNGFIDDFRLTMSADRYVANSVTRSLSGSTETVIFPIGATVSDVLAVVGSSGTNQSSRVSITSSSSGALSSSDPSPNNGVTTTGGTSPASLSVSLNGTDISVTVPSAGATASAVKSSLEANASIAALVSVSNPTGDTSTFSKTNLSGGSDASAGTLAASVIGSAISIAVPTDTTNSDLKAYLESVSEVAGVSGIIDLSGAVGNAPNSSSAKNLEGGYDVQAGTFSSTIDGNSISIGVPLNATNSELKTYLESVNSIAGASGVIDLISPVGDAPSSSGPISLSGGAEETSGSLSVDVVGNAISINIPSNTSATDVSNAVNQSVAASAIVSAVASNGDAATTTGSVNLTGGIG